MARFSKLINNFRAGELSPKYRGRTDLGEAYSSALSRMKNAVGNNAGGIARRPGSVYLADVSTLGTAGNYEQQFDLTDSTVGVKLVSMEFDSAQNFVFIVAGKDGGRASETNLVDTTDSLTFKAFSEDHIRRLSDGSAITTLSVPAYRGTSSTYAAFIADLSATSGEGLTIGSYNSFGNVIPYFHEAGIVEDYEAGEVKDIQHLQVNDLLFLVHSNHPPLVMKKDTSATFTELSYRELASIPSDSAFSGTGAEEWMAQWYLGVPYRDPVIIPGAQPTMTPSGTGNAGTIITLTFANLPWGLTAEHEGAVFIGTHASTTGAAVITRVTTTGTSGIARAMVLKAFGNNTATDDWRESAWNDYRGWPKTVAYYNGRLYYGGNYAQPNTLWASQAGDIGQMAPTSLFDGLTATSAEAFQSTISSVVDSKIQWLSVQKNLVVGTTSTEFFVNEVVGTSSTTISASAETFYGSDSRQPIVANNRIVFVDSSQDTLREFSFNFNDDNYKARSLSAFADHLPHLAGYSKEDGFLYGKIDEIAIQKTPNVMIWCLNNKGGLFGVNRDVESEILCWHQHQLGGSGDSADEFVKVKSIAVSKNYSDAEMTFSGDFEESLPKVGRESLFLLASREINSTDKVYLERLNRDYWNPRVFVPEDNDYKASSPIAKHLRGNIDMVYLDCAIEIDSAAGGASASITGLSHLEGETVRVYADGRDLGDYTVASNEIDASDQISDFEYAIVGYTYETDIITLPIEAGAVLENSQGDLKRVEELIFGFFHSGGVEISTVRDAIEDVTPTSGTITAYRWTQEEVNSRELNFLPGTLPTGAELPLFTGSKRISVPGGWTREGWVRIKNSSIFPMFISYMAMRGVTNER